MNQRAHHGMAARNGVLGALMAKPAITQAQNILDGPAGLLYAMSDFKGFSSGNTLTILASLPDYWLRCSNLPCCAHIHACIDAAIGRNNKK
jgi:2-methylcitrate dehydratase PrpD